MRTVLASALTAGCALLMLGTACAPASQTTDSPVSSADSSVGRDKPGVTAANPATQGGDTLADKADIARLESEARAIAKTTGCSSASACRTAPVGSRACGGPRTYIVYCAASTDSAALFAKLAELERAEKAYNTKTGAMSTCEFRMPPKTELSGGSCREASRSNTQGALGPT